MSALIEALLGASRGAHPAQGVSHNPHQRQPQAPWMQPQSPPAWFPPQAPTAGQAPVTPPWKQPENLQRYETIRREMQQRMAAQDPNRRGVR